MEIEYEVLEKLISEQFVSKPALIEPNIKALNIGRDYVLKNLPYPLGINVKEKTSLKIRYLFLEMTHVD